MVGFFFHERTGGVADLGYVLKIDNVDIVCPATDGVEISRDNMQTDGTKRAMSGLMRGANVCNKVSIKFAFPTGISPSELETIKNKVTAKTFKHTLMFTNEFGETEEIDCYLGDYSTSIHSFINGKMISTSATFKAVEI